MTSDPFFAMFDTIWQDLRYGVRSLWRRPLVTSVAVLSLALGIGVNTAIFSVFERLLLRRLPVAAPETIVHVTSPGPKPGRFSSDNGGGRDHIFSYPLFRDLERLENTGLSHIAAHRGFAANLAHGGRTTRGGGLVVSGDYFPALGVLPALGRLLTPNDDRVPGGHPVVVLSHTYWQTQLGADRGVIGETLVVNATPMTIVGVAAEGFRGTTMMDAPQVFVPLAMKAQVRADGGDERNDHWLYVFGRLKPDVTRDGAQALMNVAFTAIIRDVEYPVQRSGMGDRAREQFLARQIVLEDGARGRMADRDEARLVLALLLAVTGLVLLIACANVANLLLARAADRSGEMVIRISIGASTGRLMRLLLAEAALLGVAGAAGALLVAKGTFVAMLNIMPADDAPMLQFELNTSILLFALALGVGTGLLFGLFPALHSIRASRAGGLPQAGRVSATRGAARFRTSLATAQIALATVLLAQAGLFLTSLTNLGRVELGIRRDRLISFRLSPYLNGHTPERALALVGRVEDELRGVPGVTSVTASTIPLLADNQSSQNLTVEGFEAAAETDTTANSARIGTDYFRTVGIPLLAGREFSRADATGAPKVAIVNEAFARKFNLDGSVIGRRMAVGQGDTKVLDIEIVGLVRDAKYSDVRTPAPPQFFLPYRQSGWGGLTFYVRSSSDAGQLRSMIPPIVARADPNLPVERLRTMEEQIWDNVTRDRVLATLSTWFAGLATLLASIGLYAVLSYTVAQRLKEIGVRMALGARPVDVRRMVFAYVGRIAVIGGPIGVVAAFGLGRLGEALLFGVRGDNPALIGAAAAAVALVALAAAALPARRATRVNPVIALRAE